MRSNIMRKTGIFELLIIIALLITTINNGGIKF